MQCPQCSKEIPINQQFCAFCGTKVEVDFETIRDSIRVDLAATRGRNLSGALQVIAALFVLAIVGILLLNDYYSIDVRVSLAGLPALSAPTGKTAPLTMPEIRLPSKMAELSLPPLATTHPQRLRYRRGAIRKKLIELRGGPSDNRRHVREAVRMGLQYLKSRQRRNPGQAGSIVARSEGARNATWADTALTALVALAFLADGHTWIPDPVDGKSPFADNIHAAIHWLVYNQQPDGQFGPDTPKVMHQHGMATLAVVEAYMMTGDVDLAGFAQKGIDFIVRAQHRDGAWHYKADPDGTVGETSLCGWQVMSLVQGRRAGLRVPEEPLSLVASWFDSVTDPRTAKVWDIEIPRGGDDLTDPIGTTAVALMCRLAMGQSVGRPVNARAIKLLTREESLPRWKKAWRTERATGGKLDLYYFYHGTMALATVGEKPWGLWNEHLQRGLLNHMTKQAGRRVYWPNVGRWGQFGGRVYSTALAVLCLTAPYRYLE